MNTSVTPIVFDLGQFTTTGNRYFTTRSRGSNISRELRLDKCIDEKKEVTLLFPANLSGINTLFLEEFLETAVFALSGHTKFSELIQIQNKSLYSVEALVTKAVEAIQHRKEELQVAY